jgi:type VI secretion system secreted protein Hcp
MARHVWRLISWTGGAGLVWIGIRHGNWGARIMGIYLKYEGVKTGAITGAATEAGNVGSITITSLDFGLGHPIDPSTHLATGRQVVRPIVVTKEVDKASPLLLNSCYGNEFSKTCIFTYTRTDNTGKTTPYLTIAVKNAAITDFNHSANAQGNAVERLTFNFVSFEFTWITGGIMASVDMEAPAL